MADPRICVVTGSRADYGLLYWLMRDLQSHARFQLQIVATGMHLSPEFGLTVRQIEADGFTIDAKVEMLLSSDTAVGTAKSLGLGVIGFADALDRLRPDVLVLLGDRFEILAAAEAALLARIPVAHISGGDTTEGAFDEAIRHSITKMSHLHFATNPGAAQRIRQMGEDPACVFDVGSPGLDYIRRLELLSRADLQRELGVTFGAKNFLVTFHPATLERQSPGEQFQELLAAVDSYRAQGVKLIFTKPNADTGGREIIRQLTEWAGKYPEVSVFDSLGQRRYLSLMAIVDLLLGNSSSGLLEMPSFQKPTVNIGDRQKGRPRAASVYDCGPVRSEIVAAIERALRADCRAAVNPYGDGQSTHRIIQHLESVKDYSSLVRKRFHPYGA